VNPQPDAASWEAPLRAIARPARTVHGWASVELDRAERELVATIHGPAPTVAEAPASELLGASCRLIRPRNASELLLLEPSTEGLLAAALARNDEGWLATWLVVEAAAVLRAGEAGFRFSRERPGPLGRERLILGGPRAGPFVLLAGFD
jgi:hypothetical protein